MFSIVSWSIILYKLLVFRRSERQTAQFLDVFRRSNKFSEVQAVCRSLAESPLVGLFQSGYAELTAQLRQTAPADAASPSNPRSPAVRPTLKSLTAVDRALMRASVVEVNKLGTPDSVSGDDREHRAVHRAVRYRCGHHERVSGHRPDRIDQPRRRRAGHRRSADRDGGRSRSRPFPRSYFYNHLSNRVKLFASEMDDFAMEFLNIAERNFT